MYKVVIFDIGGVIHSSENTMPYEDISQGYGQHLGQFTPVLKPLLKQLDMGIITESELWKNLSEFTRKNTPLNAHELLVRNLRENAKVYREMLNLIDNLKNKKLKVVALSNVSKPHAEIVKEMGIYKHFDHAFLSYQIGLSKPEPETFEFIIEKLGVEPK